jgi:hypothetical protein
MRKMVLGALVALMAVPASAGSFDFGCMRDGPGSQACELAAMAREQQNERRREQMEAAQRAQRCQFVRCY